MVENMLRFIKNEQIDKRTENFFIYFFGFSNKNKCKNNGKSEIENCANITHVFL